MACVRGCAGMHVGRVFPTVAPPGPLAPTSLLPLSPPPPDSGGRELTADSLKGLVNSALSQRRVPPRDRLQVSTGGRVWARGCRGTV